MSDETIFEGFDPPTRNYFPMPNEWIDICSRIKSLAEIKVIFYILRHTWGYHEYGITKVISFDEFMIGRKRNDGTRMDSGTGLSRQSVIDGLSLAVKHGYIVCEVDATDLARVKKSYALKMRSGVKNLDPQISSLNSIPQGSNIYTSEVKEVDSSGLNTSPRSEKNTIERHLGNTPKERQESIATSAEDRKAPALFAFQVQNFPLHFYHDFCIHAQDRGINDGLTLIVKNLRDVPQDAECDICYKPVHGPHGYYEIGNDAPSEVALHTSNVRDIEAMRQRKTNPKLPALTIETPSHIASSGYEKEDDEPTVKLAAVKIGASNADTVLTAAHRVPDSSPVHPDGHGLVAERHEPVETIPTDSLADAAQRTVLPQVGAVQASGLPPMALTAKQIQKQLEKRVDEIFAIYAQKIGRKPSHSKANKDGALLLAQDDVSDEDIKTTIDEILKDSFLAKNLNLTFVHSHVDALARKPIPIQQNGKAPVRDVNIGVSGLPRLPRREVKYG